MSPRQVCRIVYRLTQNNSINEKEAYTLIESAFLAVLNLTSQQTNEGCQQPEEPCKVAGFAGAR